MSVDQQEQNKTSRLQTSAGRDASAEAWFECNICLETAHEPVATQCGHLYCWGCIYQWVNHHKSSCPVCKTAVAIDYLIPLYGRGAPSSARNNNSFAVPVPRRRRPTPPAVPRAGEDRTEGGYGCVSGMEVVYARVFGMSLMSSPYEIYGTNHSRHDMLATISLHRFSLFLLCCVLLCLLF